MLLVLYETVGLKNLCTGVLDSGILKTTQVADFWGGPFSRLPWQLWPQGLSGDFIFNIGYLFIETT